MFFAPGTRPARQENTFPHAHSGRFHRVTLHTNSFSVLVRGSVIAATDMICHVRVLMMTMIVFARATSPSAEHIDVAEKEGGRMKMGAKAATRRRTMPRRRRVFMSDSFFMFHVLVFLGF